VCLGARGKLLAAGIVVVSQTMTRGCCCGHSSCHFGVFGYFIAGRLVSNPRFSEHGAAVCWSLDYERLSAASATLTPLCSLSCHACAAHSSTYSYVASGRQSSFARLAANQSVHSIVSPAASPWLSYACVHSASSLNATSQRRPPSYSSP
jgi:hypothetical protein